MISRRNIRVKVMQSLYTLSTLEQDVKPGEPLKLLQKHFDLSKEMLVYLTYFLSEVAGYAERDAYFRSSKHLPSAEDLQVNTKIAGNEWLWRIKEDPSFQIELGRTKPDQKIDRELVKKIYQQLAESEAYQQYISTGERTIPEEKAILEYIYQHLMIDNELFVSHMEELFMNWDDDGDMIIHAVHSLLHKSNAISFSEAISPDKLDYAKSLLQTVLEKEEHLQTYIVPRLKNWDAERIAALDMIIMKMGVAELLYFETIPPKVTINEYIDIAKEYSTQHSGQFVNGILDNIHKELVRDDKLHKKDFRKA